ncbi:uncharacterized protein LOC143592969 [Bidens hawaiensis]|uniref:uncharacterized protein LOC143592969 n=1 Tax=Bidens hawaiensis TaxID=980011 RepID=UPI0040494F75
MREYYSYKFQIRPVENAILLGGRLTQQFTVDVYIKLETSRLQFCQHNQTRIRVDLYQGIVDCVNARDVRPTQVGKRIVLPASFIGGPRDMRCRYLDAMTLVQDDGKPDIFLTMTCNPHWPEICDNLKLGQTAQDRPDLVSRVFRAKLEDLKEQLFKKHVLGAIKDHVHVIEFQKRGLPHAHFLLVMYPHHKIHTPDQYDTFVCAEIPDPQTHPVLHNLVVAHMMHGPCGHLKPTSHCMEDVVAREREKKTMLTAFFEKNQSDTSSRAYLYRDFPKFFTWNGRLGRWNRRTRKTQRGRIVSANPAEGERYYLRLLLTHVRGPTSFDDLRTVNGVQHTTFRKAALEMELIDDDTTLSQCLAEGLFSTFQGPYDDYLQSF